MAIVPTPRIAHRNLPQRFLKARDLLMSHFRPILNHFGVTDQQWRILRLLDEHTQLEPYALCELCQIHSASMAGMLTRMTELSLIRRDRIAGDQRRVAVRLAANGDQLVREMAPLIDRQYELIEETLGHRVFDDLFTSLEAFIATKESIVPRVALPSTHSLTGRAVGEESAE